MVNSTTWLLVCDASKAKIYSMHTARLFKEPTSDNLELVNKFTHDASRKKNHELETDRMGTFGSGTFVEATTPKAHEAELFAQELLHHLESARKEGSYRDLIIVAPPTFMGILHKHMHHELQKIVSKNIEKDYTHHDDHDLMKNLVKLL
jgi:protein required for attachment to host cells